MTCLVVTSGNSEKRDCFLSQKANWISSERRNQTNFKKPHFYFDDSKDHNKKLSSIILKVYSVYEKTKL